MESFRTITRRVLLLSSVAALAGPPKLRRFNPPHLPAPVIVMIHGAGGLGSQSFPCQRYAARLARSGFIVIVPTYGGGRSGFADWVNEIAGLIDQIPNRKGIVGQNLGLLGFSQGGAVALVVASKCPAVHAVVVWSGYLPDDYFEGINRLPPLLLLHGSEDRVVPLGDAQQVATLCERRALPCKLAILTGQGHGFVGEGEREALRKTIGFFESQLAAG